MLIPNKNNKDCSFGYEKDCCCNCKYRYTVVSNGLPVGYVCKNPIYGLEMRHLYGIGGHSMCECHERIFNEK